MPHTACLTLIFVVWLWCQQHADNSDSLSNFPFAPLAPRMHATARLRLFINLSRPSLSLPLSLSAYKTYLPQMKSYNTRTSSCSPEVNNVFARSKTCVIGPIVATAQLIKTWLHHLFILPNKSTVLKQCSNWNNFSLSQWEKGKTWYLTSGFESRFLIICAKQMS